jgi:predicted nuclease of predicted toxin-antitoxin system
MRFLIDESADARVATHLAGLGHDVTTVARDHAASLNDAEVLAIAHRERRILITDDRDFGELVVRFGHPHAGVIYFRLGTTTLAARIARLSDVLGKYSDQLDRFLVVTPQSVRARQVP